MRTSDPHIAATPAPPYTAVIFTSLRGDGSDGYDATTERMLDLAGEQPGFLGTDPQGVRTSQARPEAPTMPRSSVTSAASAISASAT